MKEDAIYGAFAAWRLDIYSRRPRLSVRFFRTSLAHTVIWMAVMRGYYMGNPPTLGDCESTAPCSRLTARKIISTGVDKKYLVIRPASDDSRKRLVLPTSRTISDYNDMVDGYCDFFARNAGRRRKATEARPV